MANRVLISHSVNNTIITQTSWSLRHNYTLACQARSNQILSLSKRSVAPHANGSSRRQDSSSGQQQELTADEGVGAAGTNKLRRSWPFLIPSSAPHSSCLLGPQIREPALGSTDSRTQH